ncbi:MAG: hypothetical protein AAGA30_17710 [Planctomycetota bacterium]
MANSISNRPANLSRQGVVILREQGDLEPMIGTISHISKDDFKLIIDATLKFNELIQVVFHAETKSEYRAQATIRTMKPCVGNSLRVHGTFSQPLPDGLYLNLTQDGRFEGRRELASPCDLVANINVEDSTVKIPAAVVEFSDSGYCFHTTESVPEGVKILIELTDEQNRRLGIPAKTSRVQAMSHGFRVVCSTQGKTHSQHQNPVPKTKGWFQNIRKMMFASNSK